MLTSESPFAFFNGRKVRVKDLVEVTKSLASTEAHLKVKVELEQGKPNPTYIPPSRIAEVRMREVLYRDTPRRKVRETKGKGNGGGSGKRGYSTPPSGL